MPPPTKTYTLTEGEMGIVWFSSIMGWFTTLVIFWTIYTSYPDGVAIILTNQYGEMMWELVLYAGLSGALTATMLFLAYKIWVGKDKD